MKNPAVLFALVIGLGVLLAPVASSIAAPPADAPVKASSPARERLKMDQGWRFAFGHPTDPRRDFEHATGYFSFLAKAGYGDGPAAASFDDSAWRQLDLPHDWAVELPFDPRGTASHGHKAVGRNFPDTSVGWYRKTFAIAAPDLGRRISLEFDGIYRDASVWINGFCVAHQPSGYLGFRCDLTDYLNYGGENVVSVRVDATMEEGWFYEGAGIYRHVWLVKTSPLHAGAWGTAITTEVGADRATVTAGTTIMNEGSGVADFDLDQQILGESGQVVASGVSPSLHLAAGQSIEQPTTLSVPQPKLWSIETPTLHTLVTTLRSGGVIVDRFETKFGIRTIRFDPDHGFFLNGQRVELKGTNNHQDHAGIGVALPDAMQGYRIARLKEMGSNAYRCSHNPPTPELLEACDRLGMLVIDENRLMGTSPEQLGQLETLIRRDRNHPSVILWSLGNEEWAIEGNIKGARVAATMQSFARRLDPTRLDTVAISGGWGGISSTIDVAGFNYIRQGNTDKQHAEFPRQIGIGTEETTTQGTRGIYFDDRANAHLGPQADGSSGGNAEKGWKHYAARPYLAGVFFWTGFDYRGETTPFDWPAVGSQFGILDTCGFPKDSFYYLKAWWDSEPVLHLSPHWNWPGREGHDITVTAYSNHEAVELFLNGRSLGKKDLETNGHLEWTVSYQPGTLEARGYRDGKVIETTRVETTGQPAALRLVPNTQTLRADGDDVSVITVSVLDAQGRVVPTADTLVHFNLEGPGRLLGVGNGDPSSHEADQYHDSIHLLPVEDWRGRIAPAGTVAPGEPGALQPLPALGNWQARLPKDSEVYDLAGSFTLPSPRPDAEKLTLHLPTLGARTSVWLNGHELCRDRDTSKAGVAAPVATGHLADGLNRLQMIVTPFRDQRNHIPELTRLGAIQIRQPAPAWQRKTFNGYAQLIVQGTDQPGTIRVSADAKDLTSTALTLTSEPAPIPVSVP